MKNMKKLLGAMAALGFTTVAAVNVVACSNPTASNDLTKSFKSSYDAFVAASDATNLKSIGLTMKDANTFTLKFSDMTDAGIQNTIKANSATNPVTKLTVAATLPTASKEGEEIAQVVKNTNDGDLTVSSDSSKIVKFVVTLKLFKADSAKKFQDQSTTMDVTINVSTVLQKVDISTISVTDPGTIVADPTKTYAELNTNTTIGNLVTTAINNFKENINAVLGTDFSLTNDQTAGNNQTADTTVTFTAKSMTTSTKLVENKQFTFAIKLIAAATTVDITSGAVTDPGNIKADTTKNFGDLNTNSTIGTLVTNAINTIKANTNAALGTDFTLTNDKTASATQATGAVKFTVSVVPSSTKLTQDKTFQFTITLQAPTDTTVDISTATVTDPGTIVADPTKTYADLNTDATIGNLVTAAIDTVEANTGAVLGTDFSLTNDQTATTNQTGGTNVTFTVNVISGSTKLTEGTTFQFTISLQTPA